MAIEVRCPGCGKILHLADHVAGKKGKCPACGTAMEIPKPDEEEPVVAAIAPEPPAEPAAQRSRAETILARYQVRGKNGNVLLDFLLFRRMITPVAIQIIFWFVLLGIFVEGLEALEVIGPSNPLAFTAPSSPFHPGDSGTLARVSLKLRVFFTYFVFMPLALRIFCEALIVVFRVHGSLRQIETNATRKE